MSILIDKIREYRDICIFHHVRPDGDAIFSAAALKEIIRDNFTGKNVHIGGFDQCDLLDVHDDLSDDLIAGSLVIVTDTANRDRIDDVRAMNGAYIIKIDHHPDHDPYGAINHVRSDAAAACQVVAELAMEEGMNISSKAAEYLLCGILTDTMSFVTTNTSSETLVTAGELLKRSEKSISELHLMMFGEGLNDFMVRNEFRNRLSVEGNCGYIIADEGLLDELDITNRQAKDMVSCFGGIKELRSWAVFAYDKEKGKYDASLRSVKEIAVNEVAAKYNGGGHRNAAGIKDLSYDDCLSIVKELSVL